MLVVVVNLTVSNTLIVGFGDGAEEGKMYSHSPQVSGQFFLTTGYALQRHHVSPLLGQSHVFLFPFLILKRPVLSKQLQLSQVIGQLNATSSIEQRNHFFSLTAHAQSFFPFIHGIDSILNLSSVSAHQSPYSLDGAELMVGSFVVGDAVGIGATVGGTQTPHVTGHLSSTFGKVHLQEVFSLIHAHVLLTFLPDGNLTLNLPLVSSQSDATPEHIAVRKMLSKKQVLKEFIFTIDTQLYE
jgi:hypothetical protein